MRHLTVIRIHIKRRKFDLLNNLTSSLSSIYFRLQYLYFPPLARSFRFQKDRYFSTPAIVPQKSIFFESLPFSKANGRVSLRRRETDFLPTWREGSLLKKRGHTFFIMDPLNVKRRVVGTVNSPIETQSFS